MKHVIRCHDGKCMSILYDELYDEYYLIDQDSDIDTLGLNKYMNE